MPGLLISGPAGGGKSTRAKAALDASTEETFLLEQQELYAALLGIRRAPNGRYPPRNPAHDYVIPLVEYIRQAAMTAADARNLNVIWTNSDGDPLRRRNILGRLGPGAVEEVIDPGLEEITRRLEDANGELSDQCRDARDRWYLKRYQTRV